jgi:hypothetical protein
MFSKNAELKEMVPGRLLSKALILSGILISLLCCGISYASEIKELMSILEDANVVRFTEAEKQIIEKETRKNEARLKKVEKKVRGTKKKSKVVGSVEIKKLEEILFGSENSDNTDRKFEIKNITSKIEKNNKKIENLLKALETGKDPGGYVNDRISAVMSENKALENKRAKLQKELKETEESSSGLLARVEALEEGSGLAIEGAFDMKIEGGEHGDTALELGTFELAVSAEITDNISIEGVIEAERGGAVLGDAIIDVSVCEDYAVVQFGLTDIPFGNGPDVETVSDPITKEIMMDGGFSDVGVSAYGALSILNYNLHIGNGMGEDGGVPVSQDADNNNSKTPAGRIGLALIDGLEVGASYVNGAYIEDNNEDYMQRVGVDVCFSFDPFKITEDAIVISGEYISAEEEFNGDLNKHVGYYGQISSYFTDKNYLILGYGQWQPDYDVDEDGEDNDDLSQLTAGLGCDVSDNLLVRLEYLHPIEDSSVETENDSVVLQADISF